jgi:hypothetical protein
MPREEERVPYYTEIMMESSAGMRGARISDVSPGGCYVDTISPAIEGEAISFQFKNAAASRLKFTGTVAYVLPNLGFGIKFTDLTDEHKAAIDQIMKAAGR